jgi:hypothetical protein
VVERQVGQDPGPRPRVEGLPHHGQAGQIETVLGRYCVKKSLGNSKKKVWLTAKGGVVQPKP